MAGGKAPPPFRYRQLGNLATDWIRQAHGLGARFWACPANLELFDMTEADLIPECSGLMGAATMLHQLMEDDCRVLTY